MKNLAVLVGIILLIAFSYANAQTHTYERGSLERLTPVLMTALVATFALANIGRSARQGNPAYGGAGDFGGWSVQPSWIPC